MIKYYFEIINATYIYSEENHTIVDTMFILETLNWEKLEKDIHYVLGIIKPSRSSMGLLPQVISSNITSSDHTNTMGHFHGFLIPWSQTYINQCSTTDYDSVKINLNTQTLKTFTSFSLFARPHSIFR